MNAPKNLRQLAQTFLAFAVLSLFTGCGEPKLREPAVSLDQLAGLAYGPATEQFEEPAGVNVAVSAARLDDEWTVIRGVYSPTEAGYHLYSKDMPPEGIDETGRPTLLTLTEGAIQIGTVFADKEPHDFTQYGTTLPVYPEGPVTLYGLIRTQPDSSDVSVALTYMACTNELCNMPVEGSQVSVTLP